MSLSCRGRGRICLGHKKINCSTVFALICRHFLRANGRRYDTRLGKLHLAEYMVELARAYQASEQRAVWVQEVGTSSEWMPEAYISQYATTLLENAAACQNVWGCTWWCSHDIDPAMKGFLSLEYALGVFDPRTRAKLLGRTLSQLADEWRKNPLAVISRSVAPVIPDKGLSKKCDVADCSIAKPYMDLVSRGVRPAIVLECRAGDKAYLKSRGIEGWSSPQCDNS